MAVVNQRVCDLPTCAQPITANKAPVFLIGNTEEGKPNIEKIVEFDTGKCARKWMRRNELSTAESEYLDFPAPTAEDAAKAVSKK